MDISGPVRALLQQHIKHDPAAILSHDPLQPFIHFTTWPHELDPTAPPPTANSVPPFLAPDAPPLLARSIPDFAGRALPVHTYLATAGVLRILPRISRALRDHWIDALLQQLHDLPDRAGKLLLARTTTSVDFLWHHWLLLLARERLLLSVQDSLLKGLWRRGITAPPVAPAAAAASPEEIAAHQCAALHAAYNALAFEKNFDLLPPIEKLLAAIPPLPPTGAPTAQTPPWALSAFAGLDDSPTRPTRLLESATARLAATPDPLTLALLADSLLTQEDAASGASF